MSKKSKKPRKSKRGIVGLVKTSFTFRIIVDYGLPFDALVGAGRYDIVNPAVKGENFQIDGQGSYETTVVLFQLNWPMSVTEMTTEMRKYGHRPAFPEEVLFLGKEYPMAQKRLTIVALNVLFLGRTGRYAPCLSCGSGKRSLALILRKRTGHCCGNYFAAVPIGQNPCRQ